MCRLVGFAPPKASHCKATAKDFKFFVAVDLLVFAGGCGGHVYGGAAAGFTTVKRLTVAINDGD